MVYGRQADGEPQPRYCLGLAKKNHKKRDKPFSNAKKISSGFNSLCADDYSPTWSLVVSSHESACGRLVKVVWSLLHKLKATGSIPVRLTTTGKSWRASHHTPSFFDEGIVEYHVFEYATLASCLHRMQSHHALLVLSFIIELWGGKSSAWQSCDPGSNPGLNR